jgi:hypothetical protein
MAVKVRSIAAADSCHMALAEVLRSCEAQAARDRKIVAGIKCDGRKSYAERGSVLVAAAIALKAERTRLSLRKISARLADQGFMNRGRQYAAVSVER